MVILLKNQTNIDIELYDLSGYKIPANDSIDIALIFPLYEIAMSNHILELISSGDIIVNNGDDDLSKTDAVRYVSLFKHLNPISPDGKETVRAESRPPNTQTNFTMVGDDLKIHDGKYIYYDFSNDDDIVIDDSSSLYLPLAVGFKRKRLRIRFNDYVYIKEGAWYYFDAIKGSYVDMSVICPTGQYYKDREGNIKLATSNIYYSNYVSHHFFCRTCAMGDEMNAETCQENALPPTWELWIEITVPESDTTSFGWGSVELYRKRTVLLPGESI